MISARFVSAAGSISSLGGIVLLSLTILTPNLAAKESPPTLTTLYTLTQDEYGWLAPLVMGKDGKLYDTTWSKVVEFTPPAAQGGTWTKTVLYSFTLTDYYTFQGATGLVLDKDGTLYGISSGGGIRGCGMQGCGTVMQLTPSAVPGGMWTKTVLYNFTGGSDGYLPVGRLVIGKHGELYGTTQFGGSLGYGTVFELTPPALPGSAWTFTVVYAFTWDLFTEQALPPPSLVMDEHGVLYGTTAGTGGCIRGCGKVFQLTPPYVEGGPWTTAVLHNFTGSSDGDTPTGGLVIGKHGELYGTTQFGGSLGYGTVFELTPPAAQGGTWTKTVLYNFTGGSDGAYPNGLVVDKNRALYGATPYGGTGPASVCGFRGCGTVFELTPPAAQGGTWTETVLYNFTGGSDGANPLGFRGGLVMGKHGELYGTTFYYDPSGVPLATLFEFIP